jgi:hypothetical protein
MPFTTPGQMKYGRVPPNRHGTRTMLDGLGDILPIAAADADAIREVQPVSLCAQIDRSDIFALALPLPAATPAGTETACLVQTVHID